MDDLLVIAESKELTKQHNRRKDEVRGRGIKVNMNKTKVIIIIIIRKFIMCTCSQALSMNRLVEKAARSYSTGDGHVMFVV